MTRPQRTPKYGRHKASGQAVVVLSGKMVYLGSYGTKASRDEYDRRISEWLAAGRALPVSCSGGDLTVSELAIRYLKHANGYYANANGNTGELRSIKLVLAHLRTLYGRTHVADFGPLALKAVREKMISGGWSRSYVNVQVNRIRRIFKWAVQNELVEAGVWHALQAVDGLRHGKTMAPECDPVRPVEESIVTATLPHVSRQVKALIELQLLTGMRPGEVVIMRECDIDFTGPIWVYTPGRHKNEHRGQSRTVPIGPKGQAIINQFRRSDTEAYLFSPADAEQERREALHAKRLTAPTTGNSPGTNKKRKPDRVPGDVYDVDSYRRAIERGVDIAFPPATHLERRKVKGLKGKRWETPLEWRERVGETLWAELEAHRATYRWQPNQLRHSAATRFRKEHSLEVAQALLGHRSVSATQIYAERHSEAANSVMAQVG